MEGNQQSEIKKLRYERARQPLVRYVKNPLVKYSKLLVVYSVLILAFIALVIFAPIFSIDLLEVDEHTGLDTLPKVQETLEVIAQNTANGTLKQSDYVVSISVLDELTVMFTSFGDTYDTTSYYCMLEIESQIPALLFFVATAVVAVMLLVKNLIRSSYTMSKYSVYNYTLNGYGENVIAEIMYKPVGAKEKFKKIISNPLYWSWLTICLEFVSLATDNLLNSTLIELMKEGKESARAVTSYMPYLTGVNLWFAITLLVAVFAIGLYIYILRLKADMKESITIMESEVAKELKKSEESKES